MGTVKADMRRTTRCRRMQGWKATNISSAAVVRAVNKLYPGCGWAGAESKSKRFFVSGAVRGACFRASATCSDGLRRTKRSAKMGTRQEYQGRGVEEQKMKRTSEAAIAETRLLQRQANSKCINCCTLFPPGTATCSKLGQGAWSRANDKLTS